MALETYDDLIASILSWSDRDDVEDVAADCVRMAEARINRLLRVEDMIFNLSGGWSELGVTDQIGPEDLVEVCTLEVAGDLLDWAPLRWLLKTQQDVAERKYYSLRKTSIVLVPALSSETPYEMTYYARVPAITTDSVPWLFEQAPELYLWGSLAEAAVFVKNPAAREWYLGMFSEVLGQVQSRNERRRVGSAPAQARLG